MFHKFCKHFSLILLTALCAGWLASCGKEDVAKYDVPCPDSVKCLAQGWTDIERNKWYRLSQGSRLLPLDWVLALETPASNEAAPTKFFGDDNLSRLGYLPDPKSTANPQGLPVGFVTDTDESKKSNIMCDTFPETCAKGVMQKTWVGLNCSACHTNDVVLNGKTFRIEGAPTLADFQGFEEGLLESLIATRADTAGKLARFSKAVLGSKDSEAERESLAKQLDEQIIWQTKLKDKNAAPAVRYGNGRLDAQGHILNKVALATLPSGHPTSIKADAPASYPFVWNTSQQLFIQWNGIAKNDQSPIKVNDYETNFGALGRNAAEVIGVFAHIDLSKRSGVTGYSSSIRTDGLIELERILAKLRSPKWDDFAAASGLPPIVEAKRQAGEVLFKSKCAKCHAHLEHDDVTSKMVVDASDPQRSPMDAIIEQGTDPFLACNTFKHRSKSGNFAGQHTQPFSLSSPKIEAGEDYTHKMLFNAAIGGIIGDIGAVVKTVLTDIFRDSSDKTEGAGPRDLIVFLPGVRDQQKIADAKECMTTSSEILKYKARSLNGIWATAPYLHNGSVPTLHDLLLPSRMLLTAEVGQTEAQYDAATMRAETFGVGLREIDDVKVGYKTDEAASPFVFRTHDKDTGEPIPGNYNSGHDYANAALTPEDREALVEYLKDL
jgi:hypothetical protein